MKEKTKKDLILNFAKYLNSLPVFGPMKNQPTYIGIYNNKLYIQNLSSINKIFIIDECFFYDDKNSLNYFFGQGNGVFIIKNSKIDFVPGENIQTNNEKISFTPTLDYNIYFYIIQSFQNTKIKTETKFYPYPKVDFDTGYIYFLKEFLFKNEIYLRLEIAKFLYEISNNIQLKKTDNDVCYFYEELVDRKKWEFYTYPYINS